MLRYDQLSKITQTCVNICSIPVVLLLKRWTFLATNKIFAQYFLN